jgi:hypothetical protein
VWGKPAKRGLYLALERILQQQKNTEISYKKFLQKISSLPQQIQSS